MEIEAELQYKRGASISLTPADFTSERHAQMVSLIKVIGGSTAPQKVPSREECRFCNIGPDDCPERVRDERAVLVSDF
jgi:hypothetical protein